MKLRKIYQVFLFIAFLLLAFGLVFVVAESITRRWFLRDSELRVAFIGRTMREALAPSYEASRQIDLDFAGRLIEKISEDERIHSIGLCSPDSHLKISSLLFPRDLGCKHTVDTKPNVLNSIRIGSTAYSFSVTELIIGNGLKEHPTDLEVGDPLNEESLQKNIPQQLLGYLVVVHNTDILLQRLVDVRYSLSYLVILVTLGALVVFMLFVHQGRKQWSIALHRAIQEMQLALKSNSKIEEISSPKGGPGGAKPSEFNPILNEVKLLLQELEDAKRSKIGNTEEWTADTLRTLLRRELAEDDVIVVANRQPCIHDREGDNIVVRFPASGLVTGVEPIVRACGGTWIAHGSGSADREVVNSKGFIGVPEDYPKYRLHRIWLTPEEESGYYYGFSNEGLWPLCHITHTRPKFRLEDWNLYLRVNERFANAVKSDTSEPDPVILVQDYHFAPLPQMIKQKLPQSTIVTFWHIPWPNPEVFGICPWRKELLEGLLGSSILGFHTRFHAHNFIDTVDRYLECRVERESSIIWYNNHPTLVASYPISIEWLPSEIAELPPKNVCEEMVRSENSISKDIVIGVGVDRMDYTKGIVERLLAVERLLDNFPEWKGKFTFVQIASPSRSVLDSYKNIADEVVATAERINSRFASDNYKPIALKVAHHNPREVFKYLRAAHLCFVSSLHDGMNLVAKEFLAAKDDGLGVLILSMFTGAAHELSTSLIVNPYDLEQCAAALARALDMSKEEQMERMSVMRNYVKEHNVYRWAGRMLLDAAMVKRRNSIAHRLGAV